MAGGINQGDLQTISDGVRDGLTQVDKLPDAVRNNLYNYWQQQGVTTDQGTNITLEQLQAQRNSQDSMFDSPVFKPIEWLGSKLNWAWKNGMSPAISTAEMELSGGTHALTAAMSGQNTHDVFSQWDNLGNMWDLAHHVSPGQAWSMLGMSFDDMKKNNLTPKQIEESVNEVEAGRGQKTMSDPFGAQTSVDRYFNHGAQKYVSGASDLAMNWYADPLILAGKGAAAYREAATIRPIAKTIDQGAQDAARANGTLTPEEANATAWANFTDKGPFTNLRDRFWDMKQQNPDTFSAKVANEPTLKKSANGPLVANLLNSAKSPEEMTNVLRVTMGDSGALENLKLQNADLAYQVKQSTQQTSSVATYYNGLDDASKASPWGQRVKATLDQQSSDLADLEAAHKVISDRMDGFAMIGNMNFNSITTPAAQKARDIFEASRDWTKINVPTKIGALVNTAYAAGPGGLIRLAHSYNDIRPSTYIDTNSMDAYKQVNANLLEVKGLSQDARNMYVSRYLNAGEQDRSMILHQIENQVARGVVGRYNDAKGLTGTADEISPEVADSLYKAIAEKRAGAQNAMKQQQFGTARVDDPANPGLSVAVDEIEGDGGKMVVTPVLKSQMANSHVMMDFNLYRKAIEGNGSFWQKAANTMGPGWERTVALGDYVNNVWKFGQLFRLGYGPRMLAADDAMSQLARFGAAAGLARTMTGVRGGFQALRRAMMPDARIENAMTARAQQELTANDLEGAQKSLQDQIDLARNEGRHYDIPSLQQQLGQNVEALNNTRQAMADSDKIVKVGKAWYTQAAGGVGQRSQKIGTQIWDAPFSGAQGGLFKDLAAGQTNFQNVMGSAADAYLGRLRSMNWTMLSPAKHGEDAHMDSWLRVINRQVANDDLAVNYLKNGNANDRLVNWLSTPEGLAYKRDLALAKHLPNDQIVQRVTAQVDEWLNPAFPGGDAIRAAAGKGEVTKDMLQDVPMSARPLVNGQALSYARGDHSALKLLDAAMDNYYKFVAQLPGEVLLRNPLFAQRYNVHIRDIMATAGKSENELIDRAFQEQVQSAARYRALRDVKQNTFTMDHETKMSHALRQMGSFFGAQQESWNRWARIISDKPDILPRVAQVYGAPTRAGLAVDQNGMPVDSDGYSRDPVTGERKLTKYGDRSILIQIPDALGGKQFKQFFGLDQNEAMKIPMNTFVMVLSHGDGPNPVGAGPVVQIAANAIPKFGANDNPDTADLFQHLGILPFGAQKMDINGIVQSFMPTWARKALADQGGIGPTYQRNLWNIMQVEQYKYANGMRKDAPTWKEIDDRASKQSWLRVLAGFTLPISTSTQDPYQFFRDQYGQMIQQQQAGMIKDADQTFYDKYGDSAWVFAQSLSKNNTGLKPTTNAVKMSKYYQDLVSKVGPQWAGLIVGSEGEGQYSNGALHYEQTHAVTPGDNQTMRTQMSARDALKQSQLSQGWMQYKSYMNGLYAQLYQRGGTSFSDSGMEDLAAKKQALVTVLSSPTLPADQLIAAEQSMGIPGEQTFGAASAIQQAGQQNTAGIQPGMQPPTSAGTQMVKNPFYNEAWAQAWGTQDKSYYDRTINELQTIVKDPELQAKAWNPDGSMGMRADIAGLTTYLNYRNDLTQALANRKASGGSDVITSADNADLKGQWESLVSSLIEQNTKFGDLFSRYLSRDMGYDQRTVAQLQQMGGIPNFVGSANSYTSNNVFSQGV